MLPSWKRLNSIYWHGSLRQHLGPFSIPSIRFLTMDGFRYSIQSVDTLSFKKRRKVHKKVRNGKNKRRPGKFDRLVLFQTVRNGHVTTETFMRSNILNFCKQIGLSSIIRGDKIAHTFVSITKTNANDIIIFKWI